MKATTPTHIHITIQVTTYNRLKDLKEEGQSFDGVIKKLLRVYESTILNVE